ncbi:MAG: HD domain-containing protein, partial [Gemmatimonadota bacterium]|nr:HD domain-containing protein [Gemmatimonadota bacterium]
LNHFGQLIRVVEGGSSAPTAAGSPEPFLVLARPFDPEQVRQSLQGAIDQIRLDLQVLRGEMFRETGRLQQAIRDAQLEMVTALAVTMEAKDPYMHGHCARVAALAAQVAEEMEIGVDETERLQTAAVLHEIGKLGVSLELLHKVEPLTEGELEQLRSHPGVGAQIVGAIPSLRRLAPLIRNQYTDWADLPGHIERASPDSALAGILRVVDTFDAITSDRSYRPAAPREIWTAMLRRGAGSQFYPDAVRALFRVVERRDVR